MDRFGPQTDPLFLGHGFVGKILKTDRPRRLPVKWAFIKND